MKSIELLRKPYPELLIPEGIPKIKIMKKTKMSIKHQETN